ncbi:S9 family peptidase [Pyxidicoccus trucidator]|uniref:S9 family peptidase n=1 Tax=Pyxidicoccus trucidator TaxID=2709662 RepID=UPI0019674E20|nr:S9 family peptidase [Pyxidicoccus trucidator]
MSSMPVPVAAQRPVTHHVQGQARIDPYDWLRDANWTEVLREPSRLSAEIRAHLEAENAYAESMLEPVRALRARLRAELRARVAQEDASVPIPDGPFEYYQRFAPGRQYPLLCRRGPEGEALLCDVTDVADGRPGFRLVSAPHGPEHTLLALGTDDGSGRCTVRILDLRTGQALPERLEGTDGQPVWCADGRGLVYVTLDAEQRPHQVRLHRLGTAQGDDRLLYEEPDPAFFAGVSRSGSGRFILLTSRDHTTSEVRLIDAAAPESGPRLVAPRQPGVHYLVQDHGDSLLVLHNRGAAEDFEIAQAPLEAPGPEHWRPLVPHRPGNLLLDWAVREHHLVRLGLEDGMLRLIVRRWSDGDEHVVELDADERFDVRLIPGPGYRSGQVRFVCSSLSLPPRTYDYELEPRVRRLRKEEAVPSGHDPARYVCHRLVATSADGERVPITLLHRRDLNRDGGAPLLLYGYGAYGVLTQARWRPEVLSLVDRGFVYAIAHVRGGRERGQAWYRDGRAGRKENSFHDFIAAAEHLISAGYSRPGLLTCHGASAGGLLVGVALNRRPALFRAAVAEVGFVDALATMCDASLPLTPREWPEWGNPLASPEEYAAMAAWSPVDNVAPRAYPAVLATAGLTDPYVGYWEPARWIARLREAQQAEQPMLLLTRMDAGHLGAGGRLDKLDDIATAWAFILQAYGLTGE